MFPLLPILYATIRQKIHSGFSFNIINLTNGAKDWIFVVNDPSNSMHYIHHSVKLWHTRTAGVLSNKIFLMLSA